MPKPAKSTKKDRGDKISEEQFQKARAEIKKMLTQDTDATADTLPTKITVEAEPSETSSAETEIVADTTKRFVSFYHRELEDKTDMSKIVRTDPNRKKKIIAGIIGILFILAGAALSGFYFFVNRQHKFTGEQVAITVQTPALVASGEEFHFTVLVQNNEAVAVKDVELTMQFPDDFRLTTSQPTAINDAKNAWLIGEIGSHSSKTVDISGQVLGEVGSTKEFSALATYVPANFNSEFQSKQSFAITVNDSILTLDVEVPVKVISGRPADYKVTCTNNSSETMGEVRFTLSLPSDLQVSKFDPQPDRENSIWELGSLKSKESKTISFRGSLSADEGTMREIKAEVGYVDAVGDYHVQNEETSILSVVNPQLIVKLLVNDSANNNTAAFGQTLNYTLQYENDSQSAVQSMSLVANVAGEVLDWSSLIDSGKGTVSGATIQWNEKQVPALKTVKPGDSGEVRFSIKVKDSIPAARESDGNYSIVSTAKASSTSVVDLDNASLEVESNSLTTKIRSKLELRAEGRYYNDEYLPVGTGPLPPEVGATTTYRIYWYLRNNANEAKNVAVRAVLPAGVTWASNGSVSAGSLSYDEATRTVTWSINKIPTHVGQLIPELEAHFAVAVTPTADDVGKALLLLEKSQVRADDSFTQEELTQTQDLITSTLDHDSLAAGKGIVVPATPVNVNTNTNVNQ